jgi:hypothetical protein
LRSANDAGKALQTGTFLSPTHHIHGKDAGTISETVEFPTALTVLGNIAILLWTILDSYGLWLVSQTAGWLFLFVALIAVYGVLKFIGCLRPCYHCKRCTRGFGRMSALYFGKRSLKDPKESYGMPSAVFFFVLLGPLPAAIMLVSSTQTFSVLKGLVLVVILGISVYSASTWRMKSNRKSHSD